MRALSTDSFARAYLLLCVPLLHEMSPACIVARHARLMVICASVSTRSHSAVSVQQVQRQLALRRHELRSLHWRVHGYNCPGRYTSHLQWQPLGSQFHSAATQELRIPLCRAQRWPVR